MRPGKKRRQRPDNTVYQDVVLALSVLLGAGLLFWIWGLYSTSSLFVQYPKRGWGAFLTHWAENRVPTEQPLTMFAVTLFLLSVYLFVLFLTIRRPKRPRRIAERTAIAFAFLLVAILAAVIGDIIDIAFSRYTLEKWRETIFGLRFGLLPIEYVELYDSEVRYQARIGEDWVFLADADTLRSGNTDYRLWGVDALQTEQRCRVEDRRPVDCGLEAREAFLELMTSVPPSEIRCFHPDEARWPRTIICSAGGEDAGAWMVRRGHAFPTWEGQFRYAEALREAKEKKAGAWGTIFLHPREWKAARCEYRLALCRKPYFAD